MRGSVRSTWRSAARALALALSLATILAGCGFHLRRDEPLPFATIAVPSETPLALQLRRNIAASTRTRVIDDPAKADAILDILSETREKAILSLNTEGKVREYQLRYRVTFRVHDNKAGEYVPRDEIVLRRDITFNDQVLAKESEEALLYRDMQSDMVQLILRRLAAAKLRPAEPPPVPATQSQ